MNAKILCLFALVLFVAVGSAQADSCGCWSAPCADRLFLLNSATFLNASSILSATGGPFDITTDLGVNLAGLVDIQLVANVATNVVAIVGFDTNTNAVVVAFRGALDINAFVTHLSLMTSLNLVAFADVQGGLVVGDFLNLFVSVQADIRAAIQAQLAVHVGANVIVTGANLGAAVAVFAALDAALNINLDIGANLTLWTFGCPLIGNTNFALFVQATLTNSVVRCVNQADVIVTLPAIPSLCHLVGEVWQLVTGIFKVCNPVQFLDITCSCGLLSVVRNLLDSLCWGNIPLISAL